MPVKTIIHLIPGIYLGGSEKVLKIISTHQVKLGHSVYVISFERTQFEDFYSGLVVYHCNIKFTDSFIANPTIELNEYEDLIDRLSPQYIHSHSLWTDLISRRQSRPNIEYISHFHLCYSFFDNLTLNHFFNKKLLSTWVDKRKLLTKYSNKNTSLIAASQYVFKYYESRIGKRLAHRMKVLPNPVDSNYFSVGRSMPKYDILTVGRLEDVKNHSLVIQVIKCFKDLGQDVSLAIVGEGSRRVDLQEMSKELDISDRIFFLGGIDDLSGVFSTSRVYLHASREETFGLSILEAMASGLPVISKIFEGLDSNILVDSFNCILVESNEPMDFVNAYNVITNNLSYKNSLVTNGCQTAARFSEIGYHEEMEKIYS